MVRGEEDIEGAGLVVIRGVALVHHLMIDVVLDDMGGIEDTDRGIEEREEAVVEGIAIIQVITLNLARGLVQGEEGLLRREIIMPLQM